MCADLHPTCQILCTNRIAPARGVHQARWERQGPRPAPAESAPWPQISGTPAPPACSISMPTGALLRRRVPARDAGAALAACAGLARGIQLQLSTRRACMAGGHIAPESPACCSFGWDWSTLVSADRSPCHFMHVQELLAGYPVALVPQRWAGHALHARQLGLQCALLLLLLVHAHEAGAPVPRVLEYPLHDLLAPARKKDLSRDTENRSGAGTQLGTSCNRGCLPARVHLRKSWAALPSSQPPLLSCATPLLHSIAHTVHTCKMNLSHRGRQISTRS